MSHDEITWMDGVALATAIRNGDISPLEAVDAVLAQLESTEPKINAFVTVLGEQARDEARAAGDTRRRGSDLPPLFGVPVTVKDLCDTAGVRTTYGSRAFADHVPSQDAVNWARLKAAGAILIGKTTTPEFGMLGVTESGLTGITNNPWRLSHTAGGSSGGAAASVAAGVAPLAWGSDGGGSVRVPAACCGVVGLKASRGRFPVERPWETVTTDGPLTRSVRDAALMMSVVTGPHANDPLSLPKTGEDWLDMPPSGHGLKGLRIGFAAAPAGAMIDHEVAAILHRAVMALAQEGGAEVEEIALNLPDPVKYFEDFWAPAFVMDDLDDGADMPWTTNPVTLGVAERGRKMSAVEHYRTSTVVRSEITAAYNAAFAKFDILITPTMPVTAFPHPGASGGNTHVNGVPVAQPHIDFHRLTESPSHAGLPAITVPCGFSAEGLPVGMQIIGPALDDYRVLVAAAGIESLLPWSHVRPSFLA